MTPTATYRLQLTPTFTLDDAAALVPYLAELGVSHVYTSPLLQATPGSLHGYDVTDHGRVSDDLGGDQAFQRFTAARRAAGLGLVVDIVPNHMSIATGNRWWTDVLENGQASRYAPYFDVDWDPPEHKLRNTVTLPILGDHYGRVLAAGAIALGRTGGRLELRYDEHRLPVSPAGHGLVLREAGRTAAAVDELGFLADAYLGLPDPAVGDWTARARRHRDLTVLHGLFARLCDERHDAAAAVDAAVAALNASPAAMAALLDAQHYRLARWRTASRELAYRRFFDVDTLAGLRVEDPRVFAAVHELALQWLADGDVDGLRVDHPDGLRDPAGYLAQLRAVAPAAWIVVEKILAGREQLPSWPVDGTTGYDYLNDVNALFVDPDGEASLTATWEAVTGCTNTPADVAHAARLEVLDSSLATELDRLTELCSGLCEGTPWYRDFTRHELRDGLRALLAAMPVYRTYVTAAGTVGDADRAVIAAARSAARGGVEGLDDDVLELLAKVLLGELDDHPLAAELRARFQQLSGPVMAKGVEDTAFYRHLRLTSLCEVGGDLARFGDADAVAAFHERNERAQRDWPGAMLALSTHDTKRSEDVRARLDLLAEVPATWASALERWRHAASPYRWDDAWPEPATEVLAFQTMLGAHPIDADRLVAYLTKAARESGRHTSWTDPSAPYESALDRWVRAVADDEAIQRDLAAVVEPLVAAGRTVALAQKLLQLLSPGVPDVYQGTELWDLSLVDPDNRRPVDLALRRRLLAELTACGAPDPGAVAARADEGLPKLWLVHQALHARARHAACVGPAGTYQPLAAEGAADAHVVAFARGAHLAVVVPRLPLRLARDGGWRRTTVTLPPGDWVHLLAGGSWSGAVPVADLLDPFGVALLERQASGPQGPP